jgi:hypothetical protein
MRRWQIFLATSLACGGLAVAVVAMGSPPRKGATYVGETSGGRTVSFRVTPQGDLIRRFRIARVLVCRRGERRTALLGRFRQVRTGIRVGRTGGFHGEARVSGGGDSRIESGRVCVRGVFRSNGRVVSGRYREHVRLRDGSICTAGLVRFMARTRR